MNNIISTTETNGFNGLFEINNGASTTGTNGFNGFFETNNIVLIFRMNGIADDLFNINNIIPMFEDFFGTNKFTGNLKNNNGVSTFETINNILNDNIIIPYGQLSLEINNNILAFQLNNSALILFQMNISAIFVYKPSNIISVSGMNDSISDSINFTVNNQNFRM
jgi:hypothetical protein